MALPRIPGQRISDLCNNNHISQKELAERIGVSASQLSRIVSGETKTVSSDILNRLLEHKNFPRLISLIRIYFQDTATKGIMARNQLRSRRPVPTVDEEDDGTDGQGNGLMKFSVW